MVRRVMIASSLFRLRRAIARRWFHIPARPDARAPGGQLLVISHDAHVAGAQRVLLSLLREWKRRQPFDIRVVCVGGGPLREEFERSFPTLVLADYLSRSGRTAALARFIDVPLRAIYANTVVNGPLLDTLRTLGVPIVTHCHELQAAIERWAPGAIMTQTLTCSDLMLGACDAIARNLHARHAVPWERLRVVHASIDVWDDAQAPSPEEREVLRQELAIARDDKVVFGCGTTDWRKGPDLFVEVALAASRKEPSLRFFWIGGEASPRALQETIARHGLTDRIRFLGDRPNARRYFYVGDLFALTSREDPCALVALEAANAGLPVVSFEGAGDIPRVLGPACGAVVPFEDVSAFGRELRELAHDEPRRRRAGAAGREQVRAHHSTTAAAGAIEAVLDEATRLPSRPFGRTTGAPLVTVVVPSYNYARFLKRRLDSIARQTLDDFELLILDDASTDDSQAVIERFVAREPRARVVLNPVNSGSAFAQWKRGLAAARGKYVWIAESDDAARPRLLQAAVEQLERDPGIVIAQVQSLMIDARGKNLGRPDEWLNELAPRRWRRSFSADGLAEIRDYLAQKNTIPNASAVVFRNFPGVELLVDDSMRLCADWLFWIRLLARGRYAFISKPLNLWRQDSSNARTRPPGELEWDEGQRILGEVTELLGLPEAQKAQIVHRFKQRCVAWSGRIQTVERVGGA